MVPLFTDLSVEDFGLDRQGSGAAGDRLPDQERRRDRDGAQGQRRAAAHEARRRRPAQGRRRRLRDLRQIGRARRHQLHPEHQSSARARRRTRPHHPQPSTACRRRACIWCCRNGRCSRATRRSRRPRSCSRCAARWSRNRCAPSAIWWRPRSTDMKPERVSVIDETGKLLADGAAQDNPPAAPAPTSARRRSRTACAAGRGHRLLGGRARPRARAAHRRFRPQPHHPDLRQVRSRRPRGALEPDPRGTAPRPATARAAPVSVGNELPGANKPSAARRRATRTARPRKSSTTRSRAPPRPK